MASLPQRKGSAKEGISGLIQQKLKSFVVVIFEILKYFVGGKLI